MKKQILCIVILIFVNSSIVNGSIPRTISYQGVVTDSKGNPKEDGEYKFVFTIYNDSVSGDSLWSEKKKIETKQGLFSTELGSFNTITLPFDTTYWLEINVEGKTFTKRTKLTGAPYSFRADTAEVAKKADTAEVAKGLVENYYTRKQLETPGDAKVHPDNITEAPWLTDLPSHNHDNRYPKKSLGVVREEGQAYQFSTSLETGRDNFDNGIYSYSWYPKAENKPEDCSYGAAITFGGPSAKKGMGQLLVGWTSSTQNYLAFRSLRDTDNDWWSLKRIYHTGYKPTWDDVENKPDWMSGFDPSNYLTNASPYNTNTNTTPFKFTRTSNTNNQYLNLGISDAALHFYYNNDESSSSIYWSIESTDSENSDSTNANTTDLRLLSSSSSSKLLMRRNSGDFYEFWHSGNLLSPEDGTSDIRFKTDIDSIKDPLKKVNSLKGISFDWRESEFPNRKFPEGRQIGVIAQEVEKILPEVVRTDKDGYKSVAYSKLSALLIEAVKDQQSIIDSLKQNLQITKKELEKNNTELKNISNRLADIEKLINSK